MSGRGGDMTKRKPLPYAATAAVDDALMLLADARRALLPLVKGDHMPPEDAARRPGQALLNIQEASARLREIKTAGSNGG